MATQADYNKAVQDVLRADPNASLASIQQAASAWGGDANMIASAYGGGSPATTPAQAPQTNYNNVVSSILSTAPNTSLSDMQSAAGSWGGDAGSVANAYQSYWQPTPVTAAPAAPQTDYYKAVNDVMTAAPNSTLADIQRAASAWGGNSANITNAFNQYQTAKQMGALGIQQGPNSQYLTGYGGWQPEGSKYAGDNPMPLDYMQQLPTLDKSSANAVNTALQQAIAQARANGYDPEKSWQVNTLRGYFSDNPQARAEAMQQAAGMLGANLTADYGHLGVRGYEGQTTTTPTFTGAWNPNWQQASQTSQAGASGAPAVGGPATGGGVSTGGGTSTGGATGGVSGAPSTGINLSQVQGTTPWTVQPNQTVQAQLQQIIASDSPLMQQARTRALQTANGRGLLNSTMSQTAADSAMYDAAFPIAAADAGLYGEAARFNADASNTFSRDSNAFTRDAFMADFNLAANEWAKQRDQQRELQSLSVQQQYALDRDAVQNGYQSARDALQNGYQIARDAATQQYTLQRDATVNKFNAEQTNIDRERQDAGFQREIVAQATSDMQTLKTKFAEIVNVTTRDLNVSPENRSKAISEASAIYKPLIEAAAKRAGLDPTQATLGMTFTAEPAVAT